MKIIFSRKGFDAENGGTASPVMPDGTLLSLPIPCDYDQPYGEMHYRGISFLKIIEDLKARKCFSGCGHLDPDLRSDIHPAVPDNWKPIFGQADAAQSHLENQGVTIGDIFLFFGWFRKTEFNNGCLQYEKGTKDAHMLFGYLQIGKIVQGDEKKKYRWHPHSYRKSPNDTMYIASERLTIDGEDIGIPGAGTFKYSDDLVLTMPGMAKSRWKLPAFFRNVNISCHSKDSWKPEGYFQTVRIGQEFVVSEDDQVTTWAKNLIINNVDAHTRKSEFSSQDMGVPKAPLEEKKDIAFTSKTKLSKWDTIAPGVPVDIHKIKFANIPTGLKPGASESEKASCKGLIPEDEEYIEIPDGGYMLVKKYQNEQNYQAMPSDSYIRPAQIPIKKSRLEYLLNDYSPKDTDRWIMFNHPNHFTIYDGETKCCIYDVEYMVFETPGVEENPIVAVISQIRINQDPEQHPNDVEDDFDNVSDLIVNGL